MNGKVNTFISKIRRPGDVRLSSNRGSQPDLHHDSFGGNQHKERELQTIARPIDLGDGVDDGVSSGRGSHLAHTLDQLLADSSALSYFIHYLEACDKINLIKFWMYVEGFRASLGTTSEAARETAQQLCYLDAKNIYHKYVDEQSPQTVALPKKILARLQAKLDPEHFDGTCFDEAQNFVKELFELRYFPEFLCSVYYKKHEVDVLSRGCSLRDVLHVENLLTAFLELAAERGEAHLVEMVLAVEMWERHHSICGDDEVLEDAMAIYDSFFSLQASRSRIAISDESRRALETQICTESGRPSRHAFAPLKHWAIEYLTQHYLSSFLQSPAFVTHIADLVHAIETTVELPRADRRRPRSDTASTASSSDSLPQLVNRHFEHVERVSMVSSDEDRATDASGRSDAEATPTGTPRSQRSSRLAEIDSMGRYTPLYDTSFTNETPNAQSKIKMRLRKYLDKSSLREEELAEEVARTIIADIQTMVDSAGTA